MRRIAEVMGENQRLVGAMIGIAILKLYLETARAGLEAGLWKEPQLAAIQAQIRPINLLAGFGGSLRRERAASLWLLERPRAELEKVFNLPPPARGLDWGAALIRLGLKLCPRGWICQNQASLARSEQVMLDSFDPASRRIHAMQWTAGGTAAGSRPDPTRSTGRGLCARASSCRARKLPRRIRTVGTCVSRSHPRRYICR